MKAKTLLFFSFIGLLFSCNNASVYSKFDDDFIDQRWEKGKEKAYDFSIADETKSYDIVFKFSHVYDYQFASVPIIITITDPSGKEEKETIDLKIKDDSGKQLADCVGDVCDLSFKIKENMKLTKGNYKITISHDFNGPYLPNVIGVGLTISAVE